MQSWNLIANVIQYKVINTLISNLGFHASSSNLLALLSTTKHTHTQEEGRRKRERGGGDA